jgi:hypothetical protein
VKVFIKSSTNVPFTGRACSWRRTAATRGRLTSGLSNASQVFERECRARGNRFGYQGLCDGMVHLTHPAPLAPAHLVQATLSATSPYSLQGGAARNIVRPLLADVCPRERLAPAHHRHRANAQVDAEHVGGRMFLRGVSAKTASFPTTSSLMQTVLLSVLFIGRV